MVLASLLGMASAMLPALAVYVIGAGTAAYGMRMSYPHAVLGLCNAVTLVRLAMLSSLTTLLFTPGTAEVATVWGAFTIAVLALALDGVDGWAARRAGLTSAFGARFDMEVDSGFALVLAILAYDLGHAGLWVIALGLPRYAFVVSGRIWPWLQAGLPDRFSRKAVCVVQIGVLVLFLMPLTQTAMPGIMPGLGLGAVAAVAWSFARDIRDLRALRG
jgi:phosphatidylglycerophosphate synthase